MPQQFLRIVVSDRKDFDFESMQVAVVSDKDVVLAWPHKLAGCIRKLKDVEPLAANGVLRVPESVHGFRDKRNIRLALQALATQIFKLKCAHSTLG